VADEHNFALSNGVSMLSGTKANDFAGINAFVRGSSNCVVSSSKLAWNGISLEVHDCLPGEKDATDGADHLIVLFAGFSRCEKADSLGHYVPYTFGPGLMNVYYPGLLGPCRLFTRTRTTVCALGSKFIEDLSSELNLPYAVGRREARNVGDQPIQHLLGLLATEASSGGLSGKLYADHLIQALALRFLTVFGVAGDQKHSRAEKLPNRALTRVLDRMKAEFAADLDLATLSAESGYSKTQFLRMFRLAMGCTPHQWLIQFRLEQAKGMLVEASASMIDVALACGFSTHSHFANRFRQTVGVAPSRYRREMAWRRGSAES
jgi:AraC family transcriptional regulator